MNESTRYLLVIIGKANGIEKDLNYIADREYGVDFVDGKVMFMGTFYSPLTTSEIHEKLSHRPAFILYDISDNEKYGVNLPVKYYTSLFPESREILDEPTMSNSMSKAKSRAIPKTKKVEEYTKVDDILDKLSRNDYNEECLTENELKILQSQK